MPLWLEVSPDDLAPGDIIRVFKGNFDRMESTVKDDDEGDLYADMVGYFTNIYTDDGVNWNRHWERIERKSILPTEVGLYMSYPDKYVLEHQEGDLWIRNGVSLNTFSESFLNKYGPLTRIYTQTDVDRMLRESSKQESTIEV